MAIENGPRGMQLPMDEHGEGFALFVIGARGYFDREGDPSLDFFYRWAIACAPLRQAEAALGLRHRYGGASQPAMGPRAQLAAEAAPNRMFEALAGCGAAMGPKALAMAFESRPKRASADHWEDLAGAGACIVVDMDFDLRLKGAHCERLSAEVGSMLAAACEVFARTLGPGATWDCHPGHGSANDSLAVVARRALAAREAVQIEAAALSGSPARVGLPRL